nr:hypothetical protein CFP56_34553 [Quercus suber]
MEDLVLYDLEKLLLTKEEEDIRISNPSHAKLLEECSLSLFRKLLSDRKQNQRVLKNVFCLAWKMGLDVRIVDVAEDQIGWDRPRDVELNLRASGESHDKPTNPTLGPNQSLRGGQQDALSITGQPKQPINEAHEATSPMKLKTKASPFDNTAHLAQDPATNSTQNRKVKLKKIVRVISKTQAQDVEMSALFAMVGIKCPGNLEFLEKEESRTQKKPCNDASPPSTKLTPTLTMAAKQHRRTQ